MDIRPGLDLGAIAYRRRLDVLEMVHTSGGGHIGGSFSAMDILVSLYYAVMDVDKIKAGDPARDRFVMSKGHCSEALYAVLADLGFFPKSELGAFSAFGTRLAGHPTRKVPGVEVATGALGHGLPLAVGMALGSARAGIAASTYVLMGDGEQAEGSVWEAAAAAGKFGLENLVAVIDRNGLQISGGTEDVMPLGDIAARYAAFGWATLECDGHDPAALCAALTRRTKGKPTLVVVHTVKGKGCAEMENNAAWHHKVPSEAQYASMKAELAAMCGGGAV